MPPGKNEVLVRSPRDNSLITRLAVKKAKSVESDLALSKRSSVLTQDQEAGFQFYYRRLFIGIREERIPIFTKQLKISQASMVF